MIQFNSIYMETNHNTISQGTLHNKVATRRLEKINSFSRKKERKERIETAVYTVIFTVTLCYNNVTQGFSNVSAPRPQSNCARDTRPSLDQETFISLQENHLLSHVAVFPVML